MFQPKRILSYVLKADVGLAPNFQGNIGTLAVCKPVVRNAAQVGSDLILGMSNSAHGRNRVIYAMTVDEKLSFEEFFNDPRFEVKKPVGENKFGDNFFESSSSMSPAFNSAAHYNKPEKIEADLKSLVVVGHNFWYFGADAPELPEGLKDTKLSVFGMNGRRGHRVTTDEKTINSFCEWLYKFKQGVHSHPRDLKNKPKP